MIMKSGTYTSMLVERDPKIIVGRYFFEQGIYKDKLLQLLFHQI